MSLRAAQPMSVHVQFKSELKYKSNQDRSSALPRFETGATVTGALFTDCFKWQHGCVGLNGTLMRGRGGIPNTMGIVVGT